MYNELFNKSDAQIKALRIKFTGHDDPLLVRLLKEAGAMALEDYAEKQYGAIMVEDYVTRFTNNGSSYYWTDMYFTDEKTMVMFCLGFQNA